METTEERRTHVLLVDDHPLFRRGLGALIRTAGDLEVVGEAGNLEEVRELASRLHIDVALVDVLLSAVGGIAITRELHQLQPSCRILGLSVVEEPSIIAEMLRAGANGFALKIEPPDQILEAVRQTVCGLRYLPKHIPPESVDSELGTSASSPEARLTKREREIFELMIRGYTNTEIGSLLYIARRTVETHRYRITKKLNARTIFEMQRVAARSRP
jgi:DNA-binding NarL/FixJ family response regulator